MFDDIQGPPPERAEQLAAVVRRCRALLDQDDGTTTVQQLLHDLGTGVMDSIIITRELLGAGPGDLGQAKRIVLTSSARTEALRTYQQFVDTLQLAKGIADAVLNLPGTANGTKIVAIDGTGGSGKTTLAAAAAELLDDAVIIHGDDFYRPMPDHEREQLDAQQGYQRYFDWERLRDQILAPLRSEQTAQYQVYDWTTGSLGAWNEVSPGRTAIVEGVYCARPELAPYYHLTAYVDTPRETCLKRQQARGQNSDEWIMRWRAAEDHYLRTTWPQTRVQLLVRPTDSSNHQRVLPDIRSSRSWRASGHGSV
jgi:uridine kinase